MKDIKAILKDHGVDEDKIEEISKEVIENYRSTAEVEKKNERIKELETQNSELTEKIDTFSGSEEEIENLKAQVKEFQEKEQKREAEEKEATKRASFNDVFEAALGDKQFSNDLMRETVFEKAYKMCHETSGIGAKEAIESVTKDIEGVWMNPQTANHKMPGADQLDKKQEALVESKQSLADMLFGS